MILSPQVEIDDKPGTRCLAVFHYIKQKQPPVVIFPQVSSVKLDILQDVMNEFGYAVFDYSLQARDFGCPFSDNRSYIVCTRLSTQSIKQRLDSFSTPISIRRLAAMLSEMGTAKEQSLESFLLDIEDDRVHEKVKHRKAAESWQSVHLNAFQFAGLKWPPAWQDDLNLKECIQHLPDRYKEVAWLYGRYYEMKNFTEAVLVDLEAPVSVPYSAEKLYAMKRPWLVSHSRALFAAEYLQMVGVKHVLGTSFSELCLAGKHAISFNGSLVRWDCLSPSRFLPEVLWSSGRWVLEGSVGFGVGCDSPPSFAVALSLISDPGPLGTSRC